MKYEISERFQNIFIGGFLSIVISLVALIFAIKYICQDIYTQYHIQDA